MTDNKYGMEDLVAAAVQQQPLDFENAFNNLIVDRLQTAINDKKMAIAQQMYNYTPEENTETENVEDQDDGEIA